MRAIAIESFDPHTKRPVRLYPSMLAAAGEGYKRASIDRCIQGKRQTHGGLGWRLAPPEAFAVEFVLSRTETAQGDRVTIDALCGRLAASLRRGVNPYEVTNRLRRAGIAVGSQKLFRRTDERGRKVDVYGEVLIGRVWRIAA